MLVTKCDICRKEIKERKDVVSVCYGGFVADHSFCPRCAKPIIAFLKKHGFIEREKK